MSKKHKLDTNQRSISHFFGAKSEKTNEPPSTRRKTISGKVFSSILSQWPYVHVQFTIDIFLFQLMLKLLALMAIASVCNAQVQLT